MKITKNISSYLKYNILKSSSLTTISFNFKLHSQLNKFYFGAKIAHKKEKGTALSASQLAAKKIEIYNILKRSETPVTTPIPVDLGVINLEESKIKPKTRDDYVIFNCKSFFDYNKK